MPRASRCLCWFASIGFAVVVAASASAPAVAASTPVARRSAVGADVGWWSTERNGSVFATVPFVHYEIVPDLFLDFDVALAPQSGGQPISGLEGTGPRLGLGNPMLGAHYAASDAENEMTFFAGLRVGVPLATLGDLDSDRANDLASAASGHEDFYRWVPEVVPFVATAGFEAHPTRRLWLRMPVNVILLVPTTERREAKAGFSTRFEIEGQSRLGVGGGAALQLVLSDGFRTRREDRAQVALEPYFVFDNDRFFGRLGLLLAIDPPLGPGIAQGGVATTHMQFGGHLP